MSRKTLMLVAMIAGTLVGTSADASYPILSEAMPTIASPSRQAGEFVLAQRSPPAPRTLTGKPLLPQQDSEDHVNL